MQPFVLRVIFALILEFKYLVPQVPLALQEVQFHIFVKVVMYVMGLGSFLIAHLCFTVPQGVVSQHDVVREPYAPKAPVLKVSVQLVSLVSLQ